MNIDYKNMSNDEISKLIYQLENELEDRENEEKKELWKDVVSAIENYVMSYGDIVFKDRDNNDLFIVDCKEGFDYSRPGCIQDTESD